MASQKCVSRIISSYSHLCTHTYLPDTKIKTNLIHKAKVKKAYAKVKKEVELEKAAKSAEKEKTVGDDEAADNVEEEEQEQEEKEKLHPTRQLMLKDEEAAQTGADPDSKGDIDGVRRRTRRPGYYDKQLEKAEERRREQEARNEEFQRRKEERETKVAERERYKKAINKTWTKDGKKKLGRESSLLLDKVRKMMR